MDSRLEMELATERFRTPFRKGLMCAVVALAVALFALVLSHDLGLEIDPGPYLWVSLLITAVLAFLATLIILVGHVRPLRLGWVRPRPQPAKSYSAPRGDDDEPPRPSGVA